MKEVQAPKFINNKWKTVFLAGSIEQDTAEKWQHDVVKQLRKVAAHYVILNPRRNKWNSKWKQSIDNPNFEEQVSWELQGIEQANWVLMYFDPKTKSPITLLELGLCAAMKPYQTLVVCPEGYWRKGNVDVICRRYKIRQYTTVWAALVSLESLISREND